MEKECINTYFKKRGIRQHINFPMDISSYPLEEAKAYIRRIAEMGYNFITFHSYPEQWYEFEKDGQKHYAGHYFYSEAHPLNTESVVYPYTGNKEYFMIPEHEGFIDDEKELSCQAIEWLRCVMEEAHRCGMEIRMSLEVRDGNLRDNVKTCWDVIKQYPCLDSLELITQECGGYGPISWKKEEIREHLRELFGNAAEAEYLSEFMQDGLLQLPLTMKELKSVLDTIHELQKQEFPVPLACGIYATDSDTLNFALHFIRELTDSSVEMAFLSAHGAEAVAENVEAMRLTAEDMQRCTIYSWAEFDGSMYILQSEIEGLDHCMKVIDEKSGGHPYALAVNHWRTGENQLNLSWLVHGTMKKTEPEAFLTEYAEKNNAGEGALFVSAVKALGEASGYARYHLGNIGFCYQGCWTQNGLGYINNWKTEDVLHGMKLYMDALSAFEKLNAENAYVKLMKNRIHCSILHMTAIEHLTDLQKLWGRQDAEDYARQVTDICDTAEYFAKEYCRVHCEVLPDRGCVGNVVSYEHAMTAIINYLRKIMLEGIAEREEKGAVDEPPSPAI